MTNHDHSVFRIGNPKVSVKRDNTKTPLNPDQTSDVVNVSSIFIGSKTFRFRKNHLEEEDFLTQLPNKGNLVLGLNDEPHQYRSFRK